jgi:restriction system protein
VNYEFTLSNGQTEKTFKGTDLKDIVLQMLRQKKTWDNSGVLTESQIGPVTLKDDRDFVKTMVKQINDQLRRRIDNTRDCLRAALGKKTSLDWDALTDKSRFEVPKPKVPMYKSLPMDPRRDDGEFSIKKNPSKWIASALSKRRLDAEFENAHRKWVKEKSLIDSQNAELRHDYQQKLDDWEKEALEFYEKRNSNNLRIEMIKKNYAKRAPDAIVFYCERVLTQSEYSVDFPKEIRAEYQPDSGLLAVDYHLPAPDDLPHHKEVKYVQSKDELVEVFLSEKEQASLYDDLVHQVVLRSLYELFTSDEIGAIDSILFKGWVRSVDRGAGIERNARILSVQVAKKEFFALNLERVDPRVCFRALKSVAG